MQRTRPSCGLWIIASPPESLSKGLRSESEQSHREPDNGTLLRLFRPSHTFGLVGTAWEARGGRLLQATFRGTFQDQQDWPR